MKWRDILAGTITVAVLLTSFACGTKPDLSGSKSDLSGSKSDLSRSEAKGVIEKSESFTPAHYPNISLKDEMVQAGLHQGLWRKGGNNPTQQYWMLELTPKGKANFEAIDAYLNYTGGSAGTLVLKPIPRRVVEVTGISDGPGMVGPPGTVKIVEFTWRWNLEGLPDEVKNAVGQDLKDRKGNALFKLYDDGWRLERIE
jgi:hypothetical protein